MGNGQYYWNVRPHCHIFTESVKGPILGPQNNFRLYGGVINERDLSMLTPELYFPIWFQSKFSGSCFMQPLLLKRFWFSCIAHSTVEWKSQFSNVTINTRGLKLIYILPYFSKFPNHSHFWFESSPKNVFVAAEGVFGWNVAMAVVESILDVFPYTFSQFI